MATRADKRQQIVSNIMGGVAAGIVVSILLGLYQGVANIRERQDQIEYVSEMVAGAMARIEDANDDPQRLLYYNLLLRGLERFLNDNEASSRITYEEQESLRTALPYDVDGWVKYAKNLPENSEEFFHLAVGQFRAIPWLVLEE